MVVLGPFRDRRVKVAGALPASTNGFEEGEVLGLVDAVEQGEPLDYYRRASWAASRRGRRGARGWPTGAYELRSKVSCSAIVDSVEEAKEGSGVQPGSESTSRQTTRLFTDEW
jgi:hypothetical protein